MQVSLHFSCESVPLLDGAQECARHGVASSLQPQNATVAEHTQRSSPAAEALWPLLIDPQTGEGMLLLHDHAGLSCRDSQPVLC